MDMLAGEVWLIRPLSQTACEALASSPAGMPLNQGDCWVLPQLSQLLCRGASHHKDECPAGLEAAKKGEDGVWTPPLACRHSESIIHIRFIIDPKPAHRGTVCSHIVEATSRLTWSGMRPATNSDGVVVLLLRDRAAAALPAVRPLRTCHARRRLQGGAACVCCPAAPAVR